MSSIRPGLSRMSASASAAQRSSRQLHITGTSTFPSPLLTSNRPAPKGVPHDIASLRAECRYFNIPTDGGKSELVARLAAARSFPPAIFGPPNAGATTTSSTSASAGSTRSFNTSRDLKAVKDSSFIDFAFIPDFDPDTASNPAEPHVPVLTTTTGTSNAKAGSRSRSASKGLEDTIASLARQTIHIAEATAGKVSPFSDLLAPLDELHDGTPSTTSSSSSSSWAAEMTMPASDQQAEEMEDSVTEAIRALWRDFLDDVSGVVEKEKVGKNK